MIGKNNLLNKIKNIANTEDKKRLLSNFFSLSFLQGANYILPLITLPYLVRVLGVEYFGLLAFATSTVMYFQLLTDYGFNLTATRDISKYRNEPEKITEIFSSVMTIKMLFAFLSFIILFLITVTFDKFEENCTIYYFTFGMVIGQVLFPMWFFQGIEEMKYITFFNISVKVVFTISLFILVKEKSDYYLVPLINSLSYIIIGIFSITFIYKKFNITFKIQLISTLFKYLKQSWYIFTANLWNGIYSNSTIFILGMFTNNTLVGYYSAAERIIKIVQSLFTPIFQTLFPYFSLKSTTSKDEMMNAIKKVILFTSIIALIVSVVIYNKSYWIVNIVLGEQYHSSILIIQILSFLPLTFVLSNLMGTQIMLTNHRDKQYSKIFFYTTSLFILFSFIVVPTFDIIGIAVLSLITEVMFVSAIFIYIQRNGLKIIGQNNVK